MQPAGTILRGTSSGPATSSSALASLRSTTERGPSTPQLLRLRRHRAVINPPLKPVQAEHRKPARRRVRHPRDLHRFEFLVVHHLNPTDYRTIREVDGDHKFVLCI